MGSREERVCELGEKGSESGKERVWEWGERVCVRVGEREGVCELGEKGSEHREREGVRVWREREGGVRGCESGERERGCESGEKDGVRIGRERV